jgi:hypothetical protein
MESADASSHDKRTIESDPIGVLLAKWQRDALIGKLEQLPDVAEVIPSGSLTQGTQIGPVHGIDLIVMFERSEHPDYGSGRESAQAAMEHLQAELLEQLRPWRGAGQGLLGETELRAHVVKYYGASAGPYAEIVASPPPVDVMPAVREGSHLLIPERGTGWIDVDPEKFMRRVEQREREWKYFTEVVGMVTAWATHNDLNMKNLAVEVMVLKYCPRPDLLERLSRGEAVARFFDAAAKANIRSLDDLAGRYGEIDPSMNYPKLRGALTRAAGLSRQAVEAQYAWENRFRTSEALTHPDVFWQELFGRKYPQAGRPFWRARQASTCHVIIQASTEESRVRAERTLRELGLNPVEQWSTGLAVSYRVSSDDTGQVRSLMQQTDFDWTVVAPGLRDYLLRQLYVEGPDGRRFRITDAPAQQTVGNVAADVVEQYGADFPGTVRPAVVDHVSPDGQGRRLDPSATLDEAGVQDGDRMRVGFQARAGGGQPDRPPGGELPAGRDSGTGSSSRSGSAEPDRRPTDAEPRLFWNTRFPEDKGILLNQPHLVVARAEYLLETALEPEARPGAVIKPQEATALLNKEIRYRLEAENGEFRLPDSAEWNVKAVSASMICTDTGTEAFRVSYRASQAGQAIIKAFLIVDNGSVDQLQIELRAVSDETTAEATPRTSTAILRGKSVGRSVSGALSPDYRFTIRRWDADLWHQNTQLVDVRLPLELADQLSRVATDLYQELRELSLICRPAGSTERPLRLINSGEGRLRMAKIGAELHYRLFREPIQPIEATSLEGMGVIADRLSREGSETDPLLLQIHASDYPLPWGLLYDRSSDGGRDLQSADDVDPAGFWGRRFDIYRSVVSVDRDAQRGGRRWVKPVIGAYVPRNQEQRDFVEGLRSTAGDVLLDIDGISSTVDELMNWAISGKDSDLVYLFCHARPARYSGRSVSSTASWLGFGSSESEEGDELRAGLDQLDLWWNGQRPTNPVVILNACSSGQQDLIYGAPFVEFFLGRWGAQAFIGTDWPINPSLADMFGRRMLYEILQNRRSLREAFRIVNDEAAADSNYFPLMYAVYGLNTVQFVDPVREV